MSSSKITYSEETELIIMEGDSFDIKTLMEQLIILGYSDLIIKEPSEKPEYYRFSNKVRGFRFINASLLMYDNNGGGVNLSLGGEIKYTQHIKKAEIIEEVIFGETKEQKFLVTIEEVKI